VAGLEQNLTQYAAYHRDRRNIATHFAGIPMIVFAILLALGTVSFQVAAFPVTLAAIASVLVCLYYLRLDWIFAVVMAVVLFLMCAAASELLARTTTGGALALAAVIFVAGWALQFLGHRYEGMKPAFLDDAKQLLIGPLFVCAEAFFLLGARDDLRRHIEDRVGPTVARRDGRPLPLAPEDESFSRP
jgi:uncharacterized membrane protein YGL010W